MVVMMAEDNCNLTEYLVRPAEECIDNDMKISQSSIINVAVYTFLFCLSSVFNITIIVYLRRSTLSEQSRIHRIMLQLIIADLLVTFITIPLEIGWKLSVYWRAGDLACRCFQFLRPMGIYLGSFVIISLCIDRYYAIVHPLRIQNAEFRTKFLIYSCWTLSIICSIPQAFVFSVKTHPRHKWYTQCLDFRFTPGYNTKFYNISFLFYQIFVSFITFFLPLLVIIVTYSGIIKKIISKVSMKSNNNNNNNVSHSSNKDLSNCPLQINNNNNNNVTTTTSTTTTTTLNNNSSNNNSMYFSKNRQDTIRRAKRKTLKLAITIVIVFLICWTPYYSISIVFWIDSSIASKIDDRIYNFLFIFAVSNCLANPLVYGLTSIKFDTNKVKFKCCS